MCFPSFISLRSNNSVRKLGHKENGTCSELHGEGVTVRTHVEGCRTHSQRPSQLVHCYFLSTPLPLTHPHTHHPSTQPPYIHLPSVHHSLTSHPPLYPLIHQSSHPSIYPPSPSTSPFIHHPSFHPSTVQPSTSVNSPTHYPSTHHPFIPLSVHPPTHLLSSFCVSGTILGICVTEAK